MGLLVLNNKMATIAGRTTKQALLSAKQTLCKQQASMSSIHVKNAKKLAWLLGSLAVGGGGAVIASALAQPVFASDQVLHPPKMPWSHKGHFEALDHASIRRGYEVYKQVCAACHSMQYVRYREMVNVIFSEEEAKAEAEEAMIPDGPNDQGEMFERPGKLSDSFPSPYPNDAAARYANNGALPPDLSYITLARHGKEDYIFALLTGYADPPAGVKLMEGQHYNPYFPGGAIGMAQALYNDIIEYSDGTPASQSQLAKDVCTFLTWAARPEQDDAKVYGMRALIIFTIGLLAVFYKKRQVWSYLKTTKLIYKPRKPKQ